MACVSFCEFSLKLISSRPIKNQHYSIAYQMHQLLGRNLLSGCRQFDSEAKAPKVRGHQIVIRQALTADAPQDSPECPCSGNAPSHDSAFGVCCAMLTCMLRAEADRVSRQLHQPRLHLCRTPTRDALITYKSPHCSQNSLSSFTTFQPQFLSQNVNHITQSQTSFSTLEHSKMPAHHFTIQVPESKFEDLVAFLVASLKHTGFKEFYRPIPTVVGLGEANPYLWIAAVPEGNGVGTVLENLLKHNHLAFEATSKFQPSNILCLEAESLVLDGQQIREFYDAALKAGGKDNGPPGLRPQYHDKYYAAFVRDPATGFNWEMVCNNGDC